ncbi:FRMD4A family protein [Megaselia abdita]
MRSYSDVASGITESDRFSIKTFMSDKENSKLLQLKQRKIFLEKLLNEKNQLLLAICKEEKALLAAESFIKPKREERFKIAYDPVKPALKKEKPWLETSLDGPAISSIARTFSDSSSYHETCSLNFNDSPPAINAMVFDDSTPPPLLPRKPTIKLESPINICVIQEATFLPYKEETKPFEMADFYKYSTKFNKNGKPKLIPHS